ncbi:MAG: metallophosphoesterase, partial [Planctomycetota bacterium]
IVFVTHVGDIVQRGNHQAEWDKADQAMGVLDGVVPYSMLPGNHDWNVTGDKTSGVGRYIDTFGPQRFDRERWFGGASDNQLNTYQVFEAGGTEFLHLAIEWHPTVWPAGQASPLIWAQSVIDAHPNTPTIVTTHENVDNSPPGRSSRGEAFWQQFVRDNNQVFLVLSGHFCSPSTGSIAGNYHQTSVNAAGNDVHEVLQDYQCLPNGGNGYLRLIEFDLDAQIMRFQTYSPPLDLFQASTVAEVGQLAGDFELPLDLHTRFRCSRDDLNADGVLDGNDTVLFVQSVERGDRDADLNRDRSWDMFDVLEFLRRVDAACP